MDHLRLQSAFKFVTISRFGDSGQLMTAANLCLEAVGVGVYWSATTSVDRVSVPSPITIDMLMDTMASDRAHLYLFSV